MTAETEGLYFEYANSEIAKALDANDHSNMILLEMGTKCSDESVTTNTVNDFDACMDLCSFDNLCNYSSYSDNVEKNNCIMTPKCSYISDIEYNVYVKSSEIQKLIKNPPKPDKVDTFSFGYYNIFYISLIISLGLLFIYFLL